MHFLGVSIHPYTLPIGNEVAHCFDLLFKAAVLVFEAFVKPVVKDILFLVSQLE